MHEVRWDDGSLVAVFQALDATAVPAGGLLVMQGYHVLNGSRRLRTNGGLVAITSNL